MFDQEEAADKSVADKSDRDDDSQAEPSEAEPAPSVREDVSKSHQASRWDTLYSLYYVNVKETCDLQSCGLCSRSDKTTNADKANQEVMLIFWW